MPCVPVGTSTALQTAWWRQQHIYLNNSVIDIGDGGVSNADSPFEQLSKNRDKRDKVKRNGTWLNRMLSEQLLFTKELNSFVEGPGDQEAGEQGRLSGLVPGTIPLSSVKRSILKMPRGSSSKAFDADATSEPDDTESMNSDIVINKSCETPQKSVKARL